MLILSIFLSILNIVTFCQQIDDRYKYICGSDPFRFFSEFPCSLYPVCVNGGFKLNVGCTHDYQCTPYASDAVCVNSCCCTVPRLVVEPLTTRRFYDSSNSQNFFLIFPAIFLFHLIFA